MKVIRCIHHPYTLGNQYTPLIGNIYNAIKHGDGYVLDGIYTDNGDVIAYDSIYFEELSDEEYNRYMKKNYPDVHKWNLQQQ